MSHLSHAWNLALAGMAITACLLLASALDSPSTAGLGSHLRDTAIVIALRSTP